MKRRTAILASIFVLFITFIYAVHWHAQNGVVSLSGGMISDHPFHDETVYDTTFRTPDPGMTGIGLHIKYPSYPAGKDMTDESMRVTLTDVASDELILDNIFSLRNTGYSGDTVNEGVLLIPVDKQITGKRLLHICIRGKGIDSGRGFSIRTRHDSEWMDKLLCNGEPVDGSLYAVVYTPREARAPAMPVLFGGLTAAALLLWGCLHDLTKNHFSSKAINSNHEKHLQLPNLRNISGRSWTRLFLILIVQMIALEFGYYAGIRRSLDVKVEQNQKVGQMIPLNQGDMIEFSLFSQSRDLAGIAVDLKYGYQTDQIIEVSVREMDSDADAMTSIVSTDMILEDKKGGSQILRFPNILHDSRNKKYDVSLKYLSGSGILELAAAKQVSEDAPLEPYVSGVYRNRMFLQKLYFLISLTMVLCTFLIWYCCIREIHWLQWLPAVLIPVGLCFMLLIKPFSVPDEYIHFDEAYKISNSLLGIQHCEIPEGIYKRSCDVLTDLLSKEKMDGEAYRWERDTLRKEIRNWPNRYNEDMQLVYARRSGTGSPMIFYAPAALGLTVGRLLGFGFMGIMYLARLFQFMAGIGLLIFAVRQIPVGKPVLTALAFMPISMMELVSVSYDAVIIPVCFACFAQALRMIMNTEDCTVDDLFLLFFLTLLVVINKGGAYAPIGFLSLIAVYKVSLPNSCENRLHTDKSTKSRGLLLFIFLAVIIIVVFFSFGKVYLGKLNMKQMVGYNSRTERAGYTLAYLLRHPYQALRLVEGTLYWRLSIPLGISGAAIGWVGGIALDFAIQMIGIMYLAFSCIRIQGEAVLSRKVKVMCILTFFLSVAAFNYAMLMGWTVLGSNSITGVQGRYYIPVLPLLLIALRGRSPVYASEPHSNTPEPDTDYPKKSCDRYRQRCERNIVIVGYGYSILVMISFVITALG